MDLLRVIIGILIGLILGIGYSCAKGASTEELFKELDSRFDVTKVVNPDNGEAWYKIKKL